MRLFLLTSLFFLLPLFAAAQLTVSGRVTDGTAPLPYAEVYLRDQNDRLVTGTFTEDDGTFALTAPAGTYRFGANFLGYAPLVQEIELTETLDLGDLPLGEAGNNLDAVVVTAQKRLIEQRADRLIFNVENSVAAAGGDALAALQLAPGLRLQNGVLELIGRGTPGVLLDGRLLQLSGEELTSFLASLSAADVSKIEVIANPPARYAAAGQGGLINIVLKKGKANSWKNTSTLSHTQSRYGFSNLNNSLFYRRGKLNLSASANATLGDNYNFEAIDVAFPSGNWAMEMDSKAKRDNASARIALDYDFTDRLSLGGQYLGSFGRQGFTSEAVTTVSAASGQLDSTLVNAISARRPVTSHTANVHGLLKLDTLGRSVSFDVDYFKYANELALDSRAETFLPGGEFLGLNFANLNEAVQRIDNLNVKVDVEHPLGKTQLSYGGQLTFTETFGDQVNFNTVSGVPVFDQLLSNTFTYQENVQAAYFSLAATPNERWEWKAGLRLENTTTEGLSITLDQRNTNDYLRLFPTLFLAYHQSEDHDYSFSYGRRINRPSFRNLNPFRVYANSNAYSEGNPFLQPSFSDQVEFTHAFRGKLRTNVFLNRTIDGHGTVFIGDPATETQATLRRNFYNDFFIGIGELYSFDVGKWWNSQNQAYAFFGTTNVYGEFDIKARNGLQWNASTNNTFNLGAKTKLQVNFRYNAAYEANIFDIGATWSLDVGLRQEIGERWQLSLLFNDIFDRASLDFLASEVNGITSVYSQNYSNRFARLTASYSFGNNDLESRRRDFGNEGIRRRSN